MGASGRTSVKVRVSVRYRAALLPREERGARCRSVGERVRERGGSSSGTLQQKFSSHPSSPIIQNQPQLICPSMGCEGQGGQ